MPLLSDEQIEAARSVDVLEYFERHAPGSIRKSSSNEYCLVEHPSFKMSNGKWNWWSRGYGGFSALDYLMKVHNMGFVDAVQSLTEGIYQDRELPKMNSPPKPKKPSKPFKLPKANINNDRVYAYLRGRGISKEIIKRCMDAGILYESVQQRCVFVGKDGATPKFACERGIADDWKKDVAGSNKKFSFNLPPENVEAGTCDTLAVFESAVDVLAHSSIHDLGQTGWAGHRLSLGGTSSLALNSFLERHPEIKNIKLCLDNDVAGKGATERIIKELLSDKRYSHAKIAIAPPPIGKDYTDTLQAIRQLNIEKSTDRQKAVVSI